jgi:hypothetical protein
MLGETIEIFILKVIFNGIGIACRYAGPAVRAKK